MKTGRLKLGDTYYYLQSDGAAAVNKTLKIDGTTYNFRSTGKAAADSRKEACQYGDLCCHDYQKVRSQIREPYIVAVMVLNLLLDASTVMTAAVTR